MISHGVTSFYLLAFLIGAMIVSMLSMIKNKGITQGKNAVKYGGILFLLSVTLFSWWVYQSTFYLGEFAKSLKGIFLVEKPFREPLPYRLFEIPFESQLRVFALFHIKDFMLIVMGLTGFIIFVRKKMKFSNVETRTLRYLIFICSAVFSLLFLQLILKFGTLEYWRLFEYASLLVLFFAGIALFYIRNRLNSTIIKKTAFSALIFLLISVSLIQNFKYQPLTPSSRVLSPELPEGEYIYDFRMVNTIYKISMITFAEWHYPYSSNEKKPRIASDVNTRWQIYGLTNESFYENHIYFSPLSDRDYYNKWDLFLLHYGERSGSLYEKAEYRTRDRVEKIRLSESVIYDNGEAFILARKPAN